MLKKFLLLLILNLILPAFAGSTYDDIKNNDVLFLYFYTKDCGYCMKFAPNYGKIKKKYDKEFKFIKIDGASKEGGSLAYQLGVHYVPYVVLMDKKRKQVMNLPTDCILNLSCINKNIEKFIK